MVASPRTDSSLSPRLARGRRPLCLLTTLHPERALSRALVQHLADEMPDLRFTLREGPAIDVLWVCGYERGNGPLIRELRERHPQAVLVVTAKEPEELWASEVLAAGADHAFSWPANLQRLARAMRMSPVRRPA